jgi:hypothetical protein|tara:strand:- start:1703 stop:2005 length:303 start_codon:yes stop_codon:yes gene_type:complete
MSKSSILDHYYGREYELCPSCGGHGKKPLRASDGKTIDDFAECVRCSGKRLVQTVIHTHHEGLEEFVESDLQKFKRKLDDLDERIEGLYLRNPDSMLNYN